MGTFKSDFKEAGKWIGFTAQTKRIAKKTAHRQFRSIEKQAIHNILMNKYDLEPPKTLSLGYYA